jgi:hypothetical protein
VKSDEKFNYYEKVFIESSITIHTTISKKLGSSERGMLYSYEYKYFTKLWAFASDKLEVREIKIGKGRSRGFGRAEVIWGKEISFDEIKEGDWVYCLSQCIPSLFGRTFFEPEVILGREDLYTGWFTRENLQGQKPVFKTLSLGSIIKLKKVIDLDYLKPAGLNFIIKIRDLRELLEKVGKW